MTNTNDNYYPLVVAGDADFAEWSKQMNLVNNIFQRSCLVNQYTETIDDGEGLAEILDICCEDNIHGLFAGADWIYKESHPIEEWYCGPERVNVTFFQKVGTEWVKVEKDD